MGCCGGGDMSGIRGWFQRTGIYGYILVALLVIVAAYFIIVHQVHLAAYSTLIFIVIFIGLHLVMMGGHGSHGGHGGGSADGRPHEGHEGHETPGSGNNAKDKQKYECNEDEKGTKSGGCH